MQLVTSTSPLTVLIIEGDGAMRRFLQRQVERAGYEVVLAEQLQEGLRVLHRSEGQVHGVVMARHLAHSGQRPLVEQIARHNGGVPVVFIGSPGPAAARAAVPGPAGGREARSREEPGSALYDGEVLLRTLATVLGRGRRPRAS